MELSLVKLVGLLLWMQWRTLLAKLHTIRNQSNLLIVVISSSTIAYLIFGYLLFYHGLKFVQQFPVVGILLSQRIVYLIFGFFFLMLIFSNTITGYVTFFKNRETSWFLTLPIRHRYVFLWKFFEMTFVSSWALLFLSLPLMIAYGNLSKASPWFYFQILLVLIPFIIIPAVLGAWVILLIVRFFTRKWIRRLLFLSGAILLSLLIFGIHPTLDNTVSAEENTAAFNQLLRHSRFSISPLIPSAWMAHITIALSQQFYTQSIFYFLLLLSYASFGILLTYELMGRFFYAGWSHSFGKRTALHQHEAKLLREKANKPSWLERMIFHLPFLKQSSRALLLKDARMFLRDPTQWTQFAVFFGLLCIYVINLRNVAYDFKTDLWGVIVSYLNLGATSLTLSTLTTRFVFPQFSLEGQRLWIIGLAPIGIRQILLQKFWTSAICSIIATVSLMLASAWMLKLEILKVFYFVAAISVMSCTLSGLAVGLGVLFPNLKENNPSKIVSGFGGTLCLIISFIYIILFVIGLAFPASLPYTNPEMSPDIILALHAGAIAFVLILSSAILFIPMHFALLNVKTLEF